MRSTSAPPSDGFFAKARKSANTPPFAVRTTGIESFSSCSRTYSAAFSVKPVGLSMLSSSLSLSKT